MEPGAILAGKYRVERTLGRGGMGVVVKALHLQLGQPVAVKFLLPEVLGNRDLVERFLREAQAAVRLRSEHVARVIDVGTLDTGAPYMVLEYLDGTDLAHLPRTHLTVGAIVDLMLQACEALAEAHAIGIVHRDIKPANLFITQRPDGSALLKILDFGISKASGPENSHQLTSTQAVMGTPAYMSPEQMKSARQVDPRSDIWSLGVVLFQLLDGRAPFEAETFTSLAIKVATEPLSPMRTTTIPEGLPEVVYRCLEKDPARRFRSVGELAKALAPYARSATQAAISVERAGRMSTTVNNGQVTIAEDAPSSPSTLTSAAGPITPIPSPRSHWPIYAAFGTIGAIVVFAVIVGGGNGDAGSGGTPTTRPAPAPAAQPAPSPPVVITPPPVTVTAKPTAPKTTPRTPKTKPPPVQPPPDHPTKTQPPSQPPPDHPTTQPPSQPPPPPPPTKSPDILGPRT